jgi:uncharacterized membrane protein YcaP (DUF421 family)
MYTLFFQFVSQAIGLDIFSITPLIHMLIRSIIIYFFGVTLARFNKKLIGIRTPFNFILFIMLGSVFANAIVDEKFFLATMAITLFLILLNGLMTMLSFHIPFIESFVKGMDVILVKNGEIQWHAMKKNFITERELLKELHKQVHTNSLKKISSAVLESDGTINFIQQKTICKC